MRRHKQDEACAYLLQGVYTEVHNQNKTQAQRSIAPYIRILLFVRLVLMTNRTGAALPAAAVAAALVLNLAVYKVSRNAYYGDGNYNYYCNIYGSHL